MALYSLMVSDARHPLRANFNLVFVSIFRRQSIATGGLGTGDSAPDFRQIRCTPDWSENAVAGDHLWSPTSMSVDYCYVGDSDCVVSELNDYSYFNDKLLHTFHW